jgi:hypothetical protein
MTSELKSRFIRAVALACVASVSLFASEARAAELVGKDTVQNDTLAKDADKRDWPCIARKVPEISPATIWDGPAIEAAMTTWRNDDTLRKLSQYVISRRLTVEEVETAIKKYADGLPEGERDGKLTELFAGALSRINDDRKLVMTGIERFHKRQLERAKEIEAKGSGPKTTDATVPTTIPAGDVNQPVSAEEKYNWEIRIFQERQASIPIACEIPQLMEERAGAVARAIRANMKS